MPVPNRRREVLTWYSAYEPYGLSDPQSMLVATLFVHRSLDPPFPDSVRFTFGPDSLFCRTSRTGMRRALERMAEAGWLTLSAFTADEVSAELAIPSELAPVAFPGKWEARRAALPA